jgi:hypothetical protein
MAIALCDSAWEGGDRPFCCLEKRAIALSDNKDDHFWDRWMERSEIPFGYLGEKGSRLVLRLKSLNITD